MLCRLDALLAADGVLLCQVSEEVEDIRGIQVSVHDGRPEREKKSVNYRFTCIILYTEKFSWGPIFEKFPLYSIHTVSLLSHKIIMV